MIDWLPASSSLNFLAGICAGAGINLVTSVATGPAGGGVPMSRIGLDSVLWVLAAAAMTWAAQLLQHAERDADLEIGPDFSKLEQAETRRIHQRRALKQARVPLLLTVAMVIAAVVLMPRVFPWTWECQNVSFASVCGAEHRRPAADEGVPMDVLPARPRFLILHGWQNRRPEGHWEYELAAQLRDKGYEVAYPQLPSPDEPQLKQWLCAVEAELAADPGGEWVVVAHSLACAAWLRLPALGGDVHLPVRRLLFVAPPSPAFLAGTPELADFQLETDAHHIVARTVIERPRLACSTADPYCRPPASEIYGGGVFDVDVVAGAGHFDSVAGYGEWPSVLDWCLDGTVRLGPRVHDGDRANG